MLDNPFRCSIANYHIFNVLWATYHRDKLFFINFSPVTRKLRYNFIFHAFHLTIF